MFLECLKGVSSKFEENVQDVSKKFHVTWLPKKEGLLIFELVLVNLVIR